MGGNGDLVGLLLVGAGVSSRRRRGRRVALARDGAGLALARPRPRPRGRSIAARICPARGAGVGAGVNRAVPSAPIATPKPSATTTRYWLFLGGLEITTSGIVPYIVEDGGEFMTLNEGGNV